MAEGFQQQLQLLAQALERSAQLQEASSQQHSSLIQTLQSSAGFGGASGGGGKKRDLRPLPSHYLFAALPGESFTDHTEHLKCLKSLQTLSEDEFIKTIKSSLTEQALLVASSIDEEQYLGRLSGSRDYIECLEKLFVSSQQTRTFRLDFANLKQRRTESILEFYANLLYLAKSAKFTNVDNNVSCKDKFIDGLRNAHIKRKLLENEAENESLNALMVRAVNLESIDKNLSRPNGGATSGPLEQPEPMEIGGLRWEHPSTYSRYPSSGWAAPSYRPAPPRRGGFRPFAQFASRRPWNVYGYAAPPRAPPPGYASYGSSSYQQYKRDSPTNRQSRGSVPQFRSGNGGYKTRAQSSPFAARRLEGSDPRSTKFKEKYSVQNIETNVLNGEKADDQHPTDHYDHPDVHHHPNDQKWHEHQIYDDPDHNYQQLEDHFLE